VLIAVNDFMLEAFLEAKRALLLKEVPVGAVIVYNDKIIARGHNLKETLRDVTAHAEIIAIKKASEVLGSWRLTKCDMYVTLEPCIMCAGAILQSRINNLYIGTFDADAGACGSVLNILQDEHVNHYINVNWSYSEECSSIISEFFKTRRNTKR
jgi:tRNA(adenine34) deaminase